MGDIGAGSRGMVSGCLSRYPGCIKKSSNNCTLDAEVNIFGDRSGVADHAGHWVALRLRQDGANRDAIGAWLEVRHGSRLTRREMTVGGGHASGESGWLHVGLGDTAEAEVRVVWPDGTAGGWERVAGDGFYVAERGKPAVAWVAAR